jgi:hypothetical protein
MHNPGGHGRRFQGSEGARDLSEEDRFARDSPLEGAGFELRVRRPATASETRLLTDGLPLLSSSAFGAQLPLGGESFGANRSFDAASTNI